MPIRVLIADDHDVVRVGLKALLAKKPDVEVCGEASDGPEALTKILDLAPDVVILDIMLPGWTGFFVAVEIRRLAPQTKIVFFSIHDTPRSARECGADAFVSKASGSRELLAAIDRVAKSVGKDEPGDFRSFN
jgi:DNA-binding NarL/FixJ family response regulator